MIFDNSSPKGIFGPNMSDSPNWSLTANSRSLQAAALRGALISATLIFKTFVPNLVTLQKGKSIVLSGWNLLVSWTLHVKNAQLNRVLKLHVNFLSISVPS